jgi:hypothetical protein
VDLLRPFSEREALSRDGKLGEASSKSEDNVGEVHSDGTGESDEVGKGI